MPIKSQIAKRIIDEINVYLEQKDSLDSIMNLSKTGKESEKLSVDRLDNPNGYMTLLSEGSVLYPDGTIRLYICKGTLKDWYDNLADDFEGYVSTGHRDLNAYPVREGYFRKSDLKLVVDEHGRHDLLVKPHVNLELSNIKDLLLQDEPFAISSEFMWYHKEIGEEDLEEFTKLAEYNLEHGGSIDVPITDRVEISGFSFVGNPGNAKSGGYEPSLLVRNEEEHLKNKEILDKVLAHLSAQVEEEVKEATELEVAEVVEAPETEETTEAPEVEEVKEEAEATEEKVEAEEPKTEEGEALAKAIEAIETLKAEVETLKSEKAQLQAELETKKDNEDAVEGQLSKLAKLLETVNPTVEKASKEEPKEVANRFGRVRFGGQ
ncbi:hypothetical protein [Enterobacter sp.]|uniref:hypothetical protein n=1 Tax=Enterobacter sp. TaxID=42895 RepID=UPI0029054FED|nr:hypothetical protein [Enterobacter sp.]MDU1919306.1 hypothetical protein [Enterobacter sp.]